MYQGCPRVVLEHDVAGLFFEARVVVFFLRLEIQNSTKKVSFFNSFLGPKIDPKSCFLGACSARDREKGSARHIGCTRGDPEAFLSMMSRACFFEARLTVFFLRLEIQNSTKKVSFFQFIPGTENRCRIMLFWC